MQPDTASIDHHQTWQDAVKASMFGPGKVSASVCTALPTVVFAGIAAASSPTAATIGAAVAALGTFAYRVMAKQPVRPAAIGLAIAGLCALTAAVTGDARGFFLAPTALTVAIIVVCLGTVVVRRPLAGLLLNRLAGGPPRWYHDSDLMRVYTRCTYVCLVVNLVSTIAQIVGYLHDATWLLAGLHIANPVVFTVIIAVTVVAARKTRPNRDPLTAP